MKKILLLLFLLPLVAFAQNDTIASGPYNWQQTSLKKNKISAVVLLEGKAHDFEWMQISASYMSDTRNIKQVVPDSAEQVIIIKDGWCRITVNDTNYSLTPGSVVVLMPGQKFTLQTGKPTLEFFAIKYRSKKLIDEQRRGRSFVKIWEDIPFKPNNNGGGRRDFFECSTVLQKRFEIHVTTLKEGLRSHDPHTHRAEEIVLMIDGDTEMQIGEKMYTARPGGFYYLGSNVLHAIKNTGSRPATYFAIQFE
jgi:(S)-ureidoglycine aminohydrolase